MWMVYIPNRETGDLKWTVKLFSCCFRTENKKLIFFYNFQFLIWGKYFSRTKLVIYDVLPKSTTNCYVARKLLVVLLCAARYRGVYSL